LAAVVALATVLGTTLPVGGQDSSDRHLERAALARSSDSARATAASAATPANAIPAQSASPERTAPTTTVAPTTTPTAPAARFTLEPYRGLGAWLDVYDWST
jgi:hypothetical protein